MTCYKLRVAQNSKCKDRSIDQYIPQHIQFHYILIHPISKGGLQFPICNKIITSNIHKILFTYYSIWCMQKRQTRRNNFWQHFQNNMFTNLLCTYVIYIYLNTQLLQRQSDQFDSLIQYKRNTKIRLLARKSNFPLKNYKISNSHTFTKIVHIIKILCVQISVGITKPIIILQMLAYTKIIKPNKSTQNYLSRSQRLLKNSEAVLKLFQFSEAHYPPFRGAIPCPHFQALQPDTFLLRYDYESHKKSSILEKMKPNIDVYIFSLCQNSSGDKQYYYRNQNKFKQNTCIIRQNGLGQRQ
eukprot:TRINITY_DN2201_c0_g1_i8.p2 TRINITY_DN2201_c0_g1~~TRINITY_DN2201_c0_g1_i8.p2  ORF type:complete len:298 (+),score=-24.70 TRINITY_DN2201_c0_g1_i8:1946-2839(+)